MPDKSLDCLGWIYGLHSLVSKSSKKFESYGSDDIEDGEVANKSSAYFDKWVVRDLALATRGISVLKS
ncbi:MAG: hypothetical protein D4R69_00025 [Actinomycetales bacterium]|nr:MAG: hypothetical protein D4R69_00025 [Actinomycetales bacterium]